MRGRVQTISGLVDPESLGITLPHEHVYIRQWDIDGRFDYTGQIDDDELLLRELLAFKACGGQTIVDLTVRGIGRAPMRLRALAEQSGLTFVVGCGWYRQTYYPPGDEIDRRSVNELAAELTREITDGLDGTDIRPGIIGEVGTEKGWVSAQEERVHRAAARAQRASGLSITTHSIGAPVGMAQLDIFEEEGVDLRRVVIGHCDHPFSLRLDYLLALLDRGATIAFDSVGAKDKPIEERALEVLLDLLQRGFAAQVLLSHDVCKVLHLRAFGGMGYSYLLDTFVPRLRQAGVDDATINMLLVDNPRRVLTIT
jgi:phosphotriesterase-related protein